MRYDYARAILDEQTYWALLARITIGRHYSGFARPSTPDDYRRVGRHEQCPSLNHYYNNRRCTLPVNHVGQHFAPGVQDG